MTETASKPFRWALVGASAIARNRVAPALAELPGTEIAGVFSSSAERGRELAAALGIPRAYATLAECLGDPAVDAVYVSTTNDLHAPQACAAAAAGKHVMCEKPLALTLAEADAMLEACARAEVVLATNHHLPNMAVHRRLRALIRGGAVGEVRAVRIAHTRGLPPELRRWRTSDPRGGGIVLDAFVHDAALVRFLLDTEIESVSATCLNQGEADAALADTVLGVMRTGSGVPVAFHDSWALPHSGTAVEVHGSEAALLAREAMISTQRASLCLRRDGSSEEISLPPGEDPHRRGFRRFQEAVRGDGRVAVSGEDGRQALRAALEAATGWTGAA